MGDFVRKSTSSWIRPASPTPREGVSDFFIKNRFPPTRPKTYPKHSSQLLLSAENELSKNGPQNRQISKKNNCDDPQRKNLPISRMDSYIRIYSNELYYLDTYFTNFMKKMKKLDLSAPASATEPPLDF